MAGNSRFELNLGSQQPEFVENYINRPRENYPGSSLGRSRSFREGGENRMCSSGVGAGGESGLLAGILPPLPQCLMLEPIAMGDQTYPRTGELRRVLGCSAGTASEENYFGATNPRPSPQVAVEELKRYRESIIDSNKKARGRSRKLDEHLQKLNKYFEVVNCKKQQSNEQSTHERSGGLNLKMGTQIHRNPPDLVTEKEEDWAKNVVPNKRVRTSLAETRAECRSNGFVRQPLVMAKDHMLKDSNASDLVEEKIRKLPTAGEGWDKKMKRKRSVGPAVMRPADTEGQSKRSVYHKGSNESGLQTCDARSFRSGSSSAINGSNKLDGNPLPAGSFARTMLKNGQEKAILMRDFTAGSNKDKVLAKGNNKLHIREDNHIVSSSPVTKGKASRAPRCGSVTVAKSSPSTPRVSEAPENWEQPPSASKIHSIGGADICKRAMPSVSSSPPMAQWVGQRPPKNSRTRRANLVSPVSNHDDRQISSAGCSPSDFSPGLNSSGMNDQHPFSSMANGTQQFKVKLENGPSPARFSEGEESGAGESRLKEKVTVSDIMEDKIVCDAQNGSPSVILAKKNKSVNKDEFTAGVRRQGRGGRGSSFSTSNISPLREKVESATTIKPLQSTRPGSDKHRSKAGRPVKKVFDRKGFSRLGNIPHGGSPGFTGESDDDREELLAAANLARHASYDACSSSFWKKVEPIFASVSLQDRLDVSGQDEISGSETFCSGGIVDKSLQNQIDSEESAKIVEFIYKFQDFDPSYGKLESERRLSKVTPLYQRVLSALIVEDEIEEVEENSIERNMSLQYGTNDIHRDAEPRKRGRMEFEHGSTLGAQTWKQGTGNGFVSCNGSDTSNRNTFLQHPPQNDLLQEESGFVYSEVGVLAGLSGNDLVGPQMVLTNGCGISYSNSQYEKMCIEEKLLLELQSIGLCLDAVPDLDDREEEGTNEEIVQLKNVLYQQIGKKKVCADKVYKSSPQGKEAEARELEQVAMDRLVELAYKKILATRGSIASKYGIPKVSKHVALAFAKRTIARCQAFEDSGTSCFSEQPLRDVLFAAPPLVNEAEPSTCDDLGVGSFNEMAKQHDHHSGSLDALENSTNPSNKGGRISNRWKKKEVLLDDVGDNSTLRPPSTLGSTLLGGVKGKRSERERDKDMSSRNTVATPGQPLCRGKAKTKPKQKTAQLATSRNGCGNNITKIAHPVYPSGSSSGDLVANGGSKKREVGLMGPSAIRQDSLKETEEPMDFRNLQLPGIDSIDELGVGNDIGGPQDLFSWLNFDEDGLQDHDEEGLAIPMDDLSALF
ncbi:hypothetical protein RHGRI_027316 [Rhododendron griersonianum]|uniref:Uncharacterized protein n=1 Tax=Rhododendron griersonianum TaxID=479676 RepID=A0AAV6IW82_9ERIC|nr:hypothetical protein RHGRI_027316 [Rhododendron griersonianum]KAG5533037.1 hypothetical protein RHGRI_027316 [Rhododendron griersonianum]